MLDYMRGHVGSLAGSLRHQLTLESNRKYDFLVLLRQKNTSEVPRASAQNNYVTIKQTKHASDNARAAGREERILRVCKKFQIKNDDIAWRL